MFRYDIIDGIIMNQVLSGFDIKNQNKIIAFKMGMLGD
jgi:hypothetical protein